MQLPPLQLSSKGVTSMIHRQPPNLVGSPDLDRPMTLATNPGRYCKGFGDGSFAVVRESIL